MRKFVETDTPGYTGQSYEAERELTWLRCQRAFILDQIERSKRLVECYERSISILEETGEVREVRYGEWSPPLPPRD